MEQQAYWLRQGERFSNKDALTKKWTRAVHLKQKKICTEGAGTRRGGREFLFSHSFPSEFSQVAGRDASSCLWPFCELSLRDIDLLKQGRGIL